MKSEDADEVLVYRFSELGEAMLVERHGNYYCCSMCGEQVNVNDIKPCACTMKRAKEHKK